jgi:hypothetical protein
MLILSLKRFDLDFTTFETVKLNSRCAFDETLNMKQYTLEGVEAMEKYEQARSNDPAPMETDESSTENLEDPLSALPDEDYEYRLAGVLVHAGVAQGGHYYSFIRDRSGTGDKWYRFEDEDVTPFDPSQIETECFGGKVKRETKYSNGQVHTVESEQFANALMLWYEKVKPVDFQDDEDDKPNQVLSVPSSTGLDVFKPDVQRSNATHRSQSFLFDPELQHFLKNLLHACLPTPSPPPSSSKSMWVPGMVSMLLIYLLDVMVYSTDRSDLPDWTASLRDVLLSDCRIAQSFVYDLARKTRQVSSNWVRTFLLDCPDRSTRQAISEVLAAAVQSTLAIREEVASIDAWTAAWEAYTTNIEQVQQERNTIAAYPLFLSGPGQKLEDPTLVGSDACAVGIIISTCNSLLEYMPRCWRFSGELCWFIGAMSSVKDANGIFLLRRGLIASNSCGRLLALAVRERASNTLGVAFPGASVAADVAATQIRSETNHSSHVMAIGRNQMLGTTDLNNSRGPTHNDYLMLLEALLSIAGIPGIIHTSLVYESDETTRGRNRVQLTDAAVGALSILFKEKSDPSTKAMGSRDIEKYLRWSGTEITPTTHQKLTELIARYPVPGGAALGIDAFLAYYREIIQGNETQLQQDLHTAGFRPDLSRRSYQARYDSGANGKRERIPQESVAYDVAESLESAVDIGTLATSALSTAFHHLFTLAFDVSEPVGEYLVAAVVHMRDPEQLINQTLTVIHRTPNDWNSNQLLNAATHTLMVIASLPGDDQMSRISLIMQSSARISRGDYGAGILSVLRFFYRSRQAHQYSNELHWGYERYISILRDLTVLHPVTSWMTENKEKWAFVERDLSSPGDLVAPPQQQPQPLHPHYHHQRNDDIVDREADNGLHLDHQSNTDSDMGGLHDSDDEDDGSQFDTGVGQSYAANDGPFQVVIEDCGTHGVNGTYHQDGYFENACKYAKQGVWKSSTVKFSIFQCHVSNNTRHWYISIVPSRGSPGTSADIDFYTAPVLDENDKIPPATGWIKAQEGTEPVPVLSYRNPERQQNDGQWLVHDTDEDRSPQNAGDV